MKMNKTPLSKKRRFHRKLKSVGFIVILLVGVGFLIGRTEVRRSIYSGIQQTFLMVYTVTSTVAQAPFQFLKNQFLELAERENTYFQNKILKEKLLELQLYKEKSINIFNENRALKKQLVFSENRSYQFITTKIYQDTSSAYSQTALVRVGSKEGIQKYAPVLANGFLLGQVSEVYSTFSRILLVTDSAIKIPVVGTKNRKRFFLQGDNHSHATLLYPDGNPLLDEGETVETSGFENIYPPHIPVGKRIPSHNNFLIKPFILINDVEWIQILKLPVLPPQKEKIE
ncbi:MAG: rod shape-determining protein MreC [Alphaproteobacteria bacterium]